MKEIIRKNKYLLLCVISFVVFILHSKSVFKTDFTPEIEAYQQKFKVKVDDLNKFITAKKNHFSPDKIGLLNREDLKEHAFYYHVFRNDSLIFWNTNQLPISRFSDIQFPGDGIIHLQNGWYYSKSIRIHNHILNASFLIKKEYPYENSNLKNAYHPTLSLPCKAKVILEKDNAYPIYSSSKKFLFAWYIVPNSPLTSLDSDLLLCSLIAFLFTAFLAVYHFTTRLQSGWFWGTLLIVVLARIASLQWHWFVFVDGITAFNRDLYSNSFWAPNFGEYLIHCMTAIFIIFAIINYLKRNKTIKSGKSIAITLLIVTIVFSFFLGENFRGLIENSNIPLKIENLFELNFYSFLTFITMGVLFYGYVQLFKFLILYLDQRNFSKLNVFWIWLVTSLACIALDMTFGNQQFLLVLLMSTISFIIFYFTYQWKDQSQLGFGVIVLFLFSFLIALNLEVFHTKKEQRERQLLARRLATEQDLATEQNYLQIAKNIKNDIYLEKVINSEHTLGISEFKETMERRYFNGFWERYDIEFYLYDGTKNSLINYANYQSNTLSTLEIIIHRHSLPSELDKSMYYIKDNTSQYSYIIRQEIQSSEERAIGTLYCALKSKKIPEKIGFPRLLVSGEAHVIEPLEKYSLAKYYDGKLVSHNGKFSYPSDDFGLTNNQPITKGFYNHGEYNHYLYRKNFQDLIVLSIENHSTLHWFTSCSYLFCFFGGFLFVPVLLKRREKLIHLKQISLALRIQIVFIGLVFLTLIVFGVGSGSFITSQYKHQSQEALTEKIKYLERDIKQRYGEKEVLSIEENGNALEYILQKLSAIYQTDINIYDNQGFLLASSRAKLFNIGLLSEQINPSALFELNQFRKSEYIHEETIGNLRFLSAYVPFFNNEGNRIAFINLQHFGQQKGVEFQIKQFLESAINVAILLFALSVLFALFVSRWVTSPLRVLKESFSKVQLGAFNEPITYTANDEIGALVVDYNNKLNDLAETSQKLAKSERESAWREMAKQVAHEIKNPLTPMKLNLQQLQRVYDPSTPLPKDKITQITNSLIEQIDTLAKIANEFSNFAQLPKPVIEKIDLSTLLENVIVFFKQEEHHTIQLNIQADNPIINGDKDLLLRVFNNLISNAIQSIPTDRQGLIQLLVERVDNKINIEIKDNGCGIATTIQSSIFEPYFTTKSTGTGLGLAMCKQIIDQHHGNITFTTEENIGTTFSILLPIFKAKE